MSISVEVIAMSIFKQPLIQNPPPNLRWRDNKSSSDSDGCDNDWDDDSDDDSSDGGDGD